MTASRKRDRLSDTVATTNTLTASQRVNRSPYLAPNQPPSGAAIAIPPQFTVRIVEFIRARSRSGVIAVRCPMVKLPDMIVTPFRIIATTTSHSPVEPRPATASRATQAGDSN